MNLKFILKKRIILLVLFLLIFITPVFGSHVKYAMSISSPPAGGYIEGRSGGNLVINCGTSTSGTLTDCSESISHGASLTLNAFPLTGYNFNGWLGNGQTWLGCPASQLSCQVVMTSPQSISPNFIQSSSTGAGGTTGGTGTGATTSVVSDLDFQWSNSGAISGKTCVNFDEPLELASSGWGNNFLCTSTNVGLQWSNSGAISGKTCVQITEPNEPPALQFNAWGNNFLCTPTDRGLSWVNDGNIAGKDCVLIHEINDPQWSDNTNYICKPSQTTTSSGGTSTTTGGTSGAGTTVSTGDLLLRLHMDETIGPPQDSSITPKNMQTSQGGIFYGRNGKLSSAVEFSVAGNLISTFPIPKDKFTVAFWIKVNPNLQGQTNNIFSLTTGGQQFVYLFDPLNQRSDNKYSINWNFITNANTIKEIAQLDYSKWYFVAVKYDTATTGFSGFVYDETGNLVNTVTEPANGQISNTNGISLGFFNGLIDELHIYGRALSSAEILSLYNSLGGTTATTGGGTSTGGSGTGTGIISTGICSDDQTLFKMSGTSNAHASLYNKNDYTLRACVEGTKILDRTCNADGSDLIISLSADTNAHVSETGTLSPYSLGSFTGSYTTTTIGGDVLCGQNEAICGAENINTNLLVPVIDKVKCCRLNGINVNSGSKRIIESTRSGEQFLCNQNEVACGAKTGDRFSGVVFQKLYCCSTQIASPATAITKLFDSSTKREISGGNGASFMCNSDEAVCGSKVQEGTSDASARFNSLYCCKLKVEPDLGGLNPNNVCSNDLACSYKNNCNTDETCVASVSGDSNAHVGLCGAYTKKLCCKPKNCNLLGCENPICQTQASCFLARCSWNNDKNNDGTQGDGICCEPGKVYDL
ncbi:MAG: LamG-like jellyroll fold domain-containing protein, partial [Nanoarchaeota archaeon]